MRNANEWREVEELVNYAMENEPKLRGRQVFYTDTRGMKHEAMEDGLRVVLGSERLPWPSEDCILVSRDDASGGHQSLHLLAPIGTGTPHRVAMFGQLEGKIGRNDMLFMRGPVEIDDSKPPTEKELKVRLDGLRVGDAIPQDLVDRAMDDVLRRCLPDSGIGWHAKFSLETKDFGGEFGFDLALFTVKALAPIAMPCGYVGKWLPKRGFGCNGHARSESKKRPAIWVIGYDRVYRELLTDSERESVQRRPHSRHAHWRFLWKLAGLDRMKLPIEYCKRRILATVHKVRSVWVQASWIGPDRWDVDGHEFNIDPEVEF